MKTWRNFMANGQRTVVIGLFELPDQAERALKGLKRVGFRSDQVGFALRGGGPPVGEAAGPVDAAPGEPVEGFIPGMGAITTGGPLTGILSGAAAGAMAGGLLGTLVGLGLPEAEARQAAQGFQAGQLLVLVRANGRTAEAAELLRQHGAASPPNTRATTSSAEAGRAVPPRESDLVLRGPTEYTRCI
jgi:hypothetical protein